MRLIIAPICVLALALAAVASSLALGPRPASAITPTPSNTPTTTPTTTPTPTVGPSQTLVSMTFTNTSGATADRVDILLLTPFSFYDVTALPAGCPSATYSSSAGPAYVIPISPVPIIIPRTAHALQWPSACAMPGSSITLRFVIANADLATIQQFASIFPPPTATFLDSAVATATPSGTPTATPTTTVSELAIDCDVTIVGVQDTCMYVEGSPPIAVDVVLRWNGPATTIAAFNFHVLNSGDAAITAPPGADANMNANPDFNEAGPGVAGLWSCTPPAPDNDDVGADYLVDTPPSAGNSGFDASMLSCFSSTVGAPLPAGDLVLARVTYNVLANASAGITIANFSGGDGDGVEFGSCAPVVTTAISCAGASILIAAAPMTPTPVPPTATGTPFGSTSATPTNTLTSTATPPGASIVKIPEGNANNVDLAVPAANLWICVAGPCAGPGEGNLIVFEYATNVLTGDQDGNTVPDGLGAYEFSVEYDNFVIQSVNPSDVVFNPGPIATYPGGADGVLDGEGAARAPASCGFSLVFENVVHFGCVTAGQTPGPVGSFDVARLNVIPHPDLANDIFPGNDNGVVTVLKDNGCELVDTFGHPAIGSISGGLTPVCGDLAVTVRILEGDINLDCVVDVQDQQMIAWRYGSFFGSLLYVQWYDLEPNLHDLDIDIKDIQKVFGRDGSTCQVPVQPQPPLPPPAPFGS